MGWSAAAALVVSLVASNEQAQSQKAAAKKQEENQRRILSEQEKMRAEQQASNADKAAREKRQQIREERVRRAKVIQASENTGVAGSSGELGSIAGLGTQLGSNLGFNASQLASASRVNASASAIGGIEQQMVSDNLNLQRDMIKWGQVKSISDSIFSISAGSMSMGSSPQSGTQAPAPVVNATPSIKNY